MRAALSCAVLVALLTPASRALAQAPPPVPPPAPRSESALAADGYPMAGYHDGTFYLRDRSDDFRLYPQGRAQLDGYAYAGPGVAPSGLTGSLVVRRLRPEISGEIRRRFTFDLACEIGAAPQDPTIRVRPADVFVGLRAHPLVNLQLGRFDAPFTMENRTSDAYTPFMERSLAVRTVGVPSNKELGLMLWGAPESGILHYEAGAFLGNGQDRLEIDDSFDAMARVFFHPLGDVLVVLKDLQVGGSLRYGSRDPGKVSYDVPGLTTQGGFAFWRPTFPGAKGLTHILPSGRQMGAALEIRVPVWQLDITSELVWVRNGTREALDGRQAAGSQRFGDFSASAWYLQAAFWLMGTRQIIPDPGHEPRPHLDFSYRDPKGPPYALQLLARGELLSAHYQSASRTPGGTPDPRNVDGDIRAAALSLGANLWYSRHLRFTLDYVFDDFPGSAPATPSAPRSPVQTPAQRAIAPAQTLSPGQDDAARNTAHSLHELSLRVAVAL